MKQALINLAPALKVALNFARATKKYRKVIAETAPGVSKIVHQ